MGYGGCMVAVGVPEALGNPPGCLEFRLVAERPWLESFVWVKGVAW